MIELHLQSTVRDLDYISRRQRQHFRQWSPRSYASGWGQSLGSRSTPKKAQTNIASKKLIRIPQNKANPVNKDNLKPAFIKNTNIGTSKKHDREVKEKQGNPSVVPNHMIMCRSEKRAVVAKSDPFIMSDPATICDIDPTFYDIIKGRPIRPKSDVKVYMTDIRNITAMKADAAYLKEAVVLSDSKQTTEKAEYNRLRHLLRQCQINYVKFLKEDYLQAKYVQFRSEKTAFELANMNDQLENYSTQYVKLRNLVSSISFNLETRAVYARFLNSFAPDWWKCQYLNTYDDKKLTLDDIDNLVEASLSSLDEFKITIAKCRRNPYLFFTEPKEMMVIFDAIERQCLNYLQIDVQTSMLRNTFLNRRDMLKNDIAISISEMKELINMYELNIIFYKEKAVEYKRLFFKLLLSEFRDLYASFDSVKLFTCVQYTNMKIFNHPQDPKDSVVTLMHQIEGLYFSLTSKLDNMDQDMVKKVTKTLFADDLNALKRAHKARRGLKASDILRKELIKSFEPSRQRKNIKHFLSDVRYNRHGRKQGIEKPKEG